MKTSKPMPLASPESIWDALRAEVKPVKTRRIAVDESLGRVLACDACARHDFPPFDRAVMDGYAVRRADFQKGRAKLKCVALARAGGEDVPELRAGNCVRINTGAPLPRGADAVVMIENTRADGDSVLLSDNPPAGQHIERQAALTRTGALLIRAGARIEPGALAALVSGAVEEVDVFTRPQVALLSTGDEVVEFGGELDHGQIHDSNSILMDELIRRCGADIARIGRCPDEPAALRASLELGLSHDLLCVVGGMSKGTHDLVPGLLEDLGVEWLASGVQLKPGKPARIGRGQSGGWVLGLPGNPVSCMVCFLLFGRAILDGLQGLPVGRPPHLNAALDAQMPKNGSRPLYQPAEWSASSNGDARVTPIVWRGSGDPFGMASANALIYRPADAAAAQRGDQVSILPVDLPR